MDRAVRLKPLVGILVTVLLLATLWGPAPFTPKTVLGQGDPIPGYLDQISAANLTDSVTALVGYGPRLVNEFQIYTDDACTYGGTVYDVNNLDRAAEYARGVLEAMGYTTVLEMVPGYGHNVVATKIGTVYPNVYIELGAHLDTKPGTPGANDNASGSAAVIEIARVLSAYPSRYSMTFGLWVAEETGGFAGSFHHVDLMLAAGKEIKVGLNLDNMGQIGDGGIYRNDIWTHDADDLEIWDIMNQVNTEYGLGLTLVNNGTPCAACSDHYAYWQRGLTAISSVGGWTPSSPCYHQCCDVVANFTATQALKVTQQNLATALKLDQDLLPPTITLALSPDTIPADGTSTAVATATVLDSNGNPLTSETVTFSTSGDVGISAVTNHGDGTYSVILTASTTAGPETITATDSGVSATATLIETTYCPGTCFTDTSVADFQAGTPGSFTYIAQMVDGDVILQPTVGTEFSGTSRPDGWVESAWGTGVQSITYSGGWVTLHNARLNTSALFGPGRTIEFAARFGGGQWQFGGLSLNGSTPPWAGFDFDQAGTTLTANENNTHITSIPGSWTGTAHRYRIDWNVAPSAGDIVYYIDGVEVARHEHLETGSMSPMFTDYAADGAANQVNWVHMSPYAGSGEFYSRVFDAGGPAVWGLVTWAAETPSGTDITISARAGDTATPDGTWGEFLPVGNGASVGASGRYLQYRAELATSDSRLTPTFSEISLQYTPGEVGPPTQLGFLVQPAGAVAGNPFVTQPVVAVQDASGYTIIGDNSTQVALAIGTNPSGGVLTCDANPVTVVDGVATFAGCSIDGTGSGYTLVASGGSLTDATSSSFNVTQVAPGSITLVLTPDTISANGTATAVATATVRDAGGNPLAGETVVFDTSGDVTFGPVTDNGDGTYSVIVTASTTPGYETITATDGPVSDSAILHETANCPGTCMIDTSSSDFLYGTPGSAGYVAETDDGEVILAPTVGAEFYGTALPAGWEVLTYGGVSPNVTVSGGRVSIGTARLRALGLYGPGRVEEFVATYTGGTYQSGGLGYSFDGGDGYIWATFDTVSVGTALHTNTNNAYYPVPGSWLNVPHRYRIEWTATGVTYLIDGAQVRSDTATFLQNMRPMFADNVADANLLQVDWVRLSPYADTGTFLSRVLDGGEQAAWGVASWTAETPPGTSLAISVRSGNTPTPDGTWTGFSPVANGSSIGVTARYVQYQAVLATSNPDQTPALQDICFSYTDTTLPTIVSRSPAPDAAGVGVDTTVSVGFSEPMLVSTITPASFRLRALGAQSDVPATVTYAGTTATLTPNAPLAFGTQYRVTVAASVSDLSGNLLGEDVTWSFTTGAGTFTDTTSEDFCGGTPTGIYVTANGELILNPSFVEEFSGSGTAPPGGWTAANWNGTAQVVLGGGWISLRTAQLYTNGFYTPGRSMEFVANFGGGSYQTGGLGNTGSAYPLAAFNYDLAGTNLRARTGDYVTLVPNPDSWDGAAHRYRVDWDITPGQVVFYIDGMSAGTHSYTAASMRPLFTDHANDSLANQIDWVRLSPYAAEGTFVSRVFDAGGTVRWIDLAYNAITPAGASATFETRTSADGVAWSEWAAVNSPIASPNGRYLQYRASLTTSDSWVTPEIQDVTITYGNPTAVTLAFFVAQPGVDQILLTWETVSEIDTLGFNLYRGDVLHAPYLQMNDSLIPSQNMGGAQGAVYDWQDAAVDAGVTYYYKLEVIDLRGGRTVYGPVLAQATYGVYLPLVTR